MNEFDTFTAAVYNTLGVGHENAQTRRELCRKLKCGDRMLRKAIEVLRYDYAILTRDDGKGYFLPETTERGRIEARRWIRRQERRIASIRAAQGGAKRFSEYGNVAARKARKDVPGQIDMFSAASGGRYG